MATLLEVRRNAVGIMLRSHWVVAVNFWGLNMFQQRIVLQKSALVFVVEVFFGLRPSNWRLFTEI